MYPYTQEGFSSTVSVENPIKLNGFDYARGAEEQHRSTEQREY
jgi:hypothetical protein